MISIGEKNTQLLIKKHESCNISSCKEKRQGILYILTILCLYYTLPMLQLGKSSPREKVSTEILVQQSSRVFKEQFKKKKKNIFYKVKLYVNFTESIVKEIFRKHVLASRSSHLDVFCKNYPADFFLKHYLHFEQIHLKIPADVVFIF